MKRFIQSIAVFAAVAMAAMACTNEALAPAEASTPVLDAPGMSIKVLEAKDDSFSVEFAPTGEALAYSYMITAAPIAAPDSSAIYALSGSALAAERIKYAKTKTYTVYMDADKGVTPNSKYYIYAVAANKENNVGAVATATVSTSDTVAPDFTSFDFGDNQVLLNFTEAISYDKSKEITAQVQAWRYPVGAPVIAKTVATVQTAGNQALLTFDEITTPGMLYFVNIPAGAFVDAVGQGTPEVVSSIEGVDSENEDNPYAPIFADGSIYGWIEPEEGGLECTSLLPTDVLVDASGYIKLIQTATMLDRVASNSVDVITIHEGSSKSVTTSFHLASAPEYGALDLFTVGAQIPELPDRGDMIGFHIKEGALVDIYGNTSPEMELGPVLYSFGYTIDDIAGDYVFHSTSAYAAYGYGPYDNVLTIAASDNEENGNVMFTGELSDINVKFYGKFDVDQGTLVVNRAQVVGTCVDVAWDGDDPMVDESGNYVMATYYALLYLSNGSGLYSNNLDFTVPAAHTITFDYAPYNGVYVGILEADASGSLVAFYDLLKITGIEYQATTAGAPAAPASKAVRDFVRKPFENKGLGMLK